MNEFAVDEDDGFVFYYSIDGSQMELQQVSTDSREADDDDKVTEILQETAEKENFEYQGDDEQSSTLEQILRRYSRVRRAP